MFLGNVIRRRHAGVQIIERPFQGRDNEPAVARIILIISEAIERARDFCACRLKLKNHFEEIAIAIVLKQTVIIAKMPHCDSAFEGTFRQRMMNVAILVAHPLDSFGQRIWLQRRNLFSFALGKCSPLVRFQRLLQPGPTHFTRHDFFAIRMPLILFEQLHVLVRARVRFAHELLVTEFIQRLFILNFKFPFFRIRQIDLIELFQPGAQRLIAGSNLLLLIFRRKLPLRR